MTLIKELLIREGFQWLGELLLIILSKATKRSNYYNFLSLDSSLSLTRTSTNDCSLKWLQRWETLEWFERWNGAPIYSRNVSTPGQYIILVYLYLGVVKWNMLWNVLLLEGFFCISTIDLYLVWKEKPWWWQVSSYG